MRPIRKWLITTAVVLALLLPLATVASADPGDGGFSLISPLTSTASISPKGK